MGGESNTDVWEQLILLIECPFIALSATLSNSTNIFEWLKSLEKHKSQFNPLNKRKIKLIEYLDRHNDLKRFIYTNSEFKSIHPVGFLNVSSVKKHPPEGCRRSSVDSSALSILSPRVQISSRNIFALFHLNCDMLKRRK